MKCSGINCPIKHECERFRTHSITDGLLTPPFTIKNGVFQCTMFWGSRQNDIMDQLKSIVGLKKK